MRFMVLISEIQEYQGKSFKPTTIQFIYHFSISTLCNSNELLQFADDTFILNGHLPADEGVRSLQENLTVINSFFKDYGLPTAPHKTILIVFDRSKHANPLSYKITFQGNEIVKYRKKLLNIVKVLRGTWYRGRPQALIVKHGSAILV